LFTLERDGDARWAIAREAFLGDRVSLAMAKPGAWYAALDHGHFGVKLHRSTDRGATWPEIPAPAYPPKPDDVTYTDGAGRTIPWNVMQIWSLAPGSGDALWCGTIPGGVFYSFDDGETWTLNRALWEHPGRGEWFGGGADYPGVHSICVDPRDSRRVVVGVSCGGAWQTRDGGASWQVCSRGMFAAYVPPERREDPAIQDPHYIVQCRARPEVFWAQHHNGVFRSTDDCESWHEIATVEPSTFGFAVAVHPRDPDTAWFVPAVSDELRVPVAGQLVVARTRDGGAGFEALRAGLPQQRAYHLIYRHALAVDDTGDVLAFGSTTGSLWVTADQGDTWTAVSHHLPPIHAVTFA
jgi:hypothetical protein